MSINSIIDRGLSARQVLERLGWTGANPLTATHAFQQGWAYGTPLAEDGIVGPKTIAALKVSFAALSAGKGTASQHFSFREFACKCNGTYSNCSRVWVRRELVSALETLRSSYYKTGLVVVSGCRCQRHNRAVGGASASQHMNGTAADVVPVATVAQVRALKRFSGLGYVKTGRVSHVDMRHLVSAGSTSQPVTWAY